MKNCPKCKELIGDMADECFNCGYNFKLRKVPTREEKEVMHETIVRMHETIARREEEEQRVRNETVSKNPRYEYETVVVADTSSGKFDKAEVDNVLRKYSREGWRLHSVISNELGKTSTTVGVGGFGGGVNATINETLFIFERIIYKGDL